MTGTTANHGPMGWLRGHLMHINIVLTVLVAVQCLLIGVGAEHPSLVSAAQPAMPPTSTPATSTRRQPPRPLLLTVLRQAGRITETFPPITVVAVDQNDPTTIVQTEITLQSTVDATALKQLVTQGDTATVMMPKVMLAVDTVAQTYLGPGNKWPNVSGAAPSNVQDFAAAQKRALTTDMNTICRAEFDATSVLRQQAWLANRTNLLVKFPDPQC